MKNNRIIFTAILLLSAGLLFAQSDSDAELSVPNYPALNIIGSQTTEITKPGDYSGLAASIISPLVSNDGTIPSDLAVEFQPYFFDSERRTLDDYIKMNAENAFWPLIGRNSKISIASNELIASDSSLYSRVGIGYRTLLLEPKFSKVYTENVRGPQIGAITILITAIHAGKSLNEAEILDTYKKDYPESQEVIDIITNVNISPETKISKLNQLIEEFNKPKSWVDSAVYDVSLRKGLSIEFATAASFDFKDRNISNAAAFQRWGVWFNFTYKISDKSPKGFYINNLSLLTRLSNYSLNPTVIFDKSGTFLDGGINFQLGLSKRLDLTGEYILRYAASDFSIQMAEDVTNVASGTIESKLSATLVLHISDNVSSTFSYSLINGEQSYTPENIQMLVLGLTAAILPLKK